MIQSLLLFTAIFIFSVELHSTTVQKASPEVIHGHTLPPEPDPTINNATLLGVDSNDNGVRDDVERKIYLNYPKAIEQAVLMQMAKANQALLGGDYINDAEIFERKNTKALLCRRYLNFYKNTNIQRVSKTMSAMQYNTKERTKAYLDYNRALSGGVYSMPGAKYLKEDYCEFNIDSMLKAEK
ncbi:MAG: hypothetical protein K0U47_12225 [Epsilonproteobacteria bacterium]|nr:hypothetical protein [Campylobacterota bacterium]